MKYLIATILIAVLIVSGQARSTEKGEQEINKRFLGSIGSWINNNIIDPINQNVINPITTGINNIIEPISSGINDALNTIANPLQNFYNQIDNFFSNTLNSAINSALDAIKDTAGQVVNVVNTIFNGNQGTYTGQDPCTMTCFQRVNYNGQQLDYYYDRPNGCVSKGYVDSSVAMFNSCCDKHNECLNSKCCTTGCQSLKNDCDTEYDTCLKNTCVQFISDNAKFYTCLARGALIASVAVNQTCTPSLSVNRKLCFC
jgi:hypothetical protein